MAEVLDNRSWEKAIRRSTVYSQIALSTNNFDYFSGLVAMQKFAPHKVVTFDMMSRGARLGDSITAMNEIPKETKDTLQKLAEDNTKTIETKTKELKDELANMPESEKKDPDAWKKKIHDGIEKSINNFAAIARASEQMAINTIERLPPQQREEAASQWEQAWAWVMGCVKIFMATFDTLINGLIEVMHKIQEAIEDAYNTVKDAVVYTVSEIGRFFAGL